jgi:DNA-binding response OmpR family regulator
MTKTVLLIDYDPNSIGRIRKLLGPLGVRIELAMDGRRGLAEIRRLRPDVTIVQDLVPQVSGLDVCREIKTSEDASRLAVVILTGPRRHVELMKTECDAYIEKPYQDEELLEVVSVLLEREVAPEAAEATRTDVPAKTDRPATVPVPVELTEDDLDACLDQVLVLAPVPAASAG